MLNLLVSITFFFFTLSTALAGNKYIAASGSHSDINNALSGATAPGDTVIIPNGTWLLNGKIDNIQSDGILIMAESDTNGVTLIRNSDSYDWMLQIDGRDSVRITGIRFDGNNSNYTRGGINIKSMDGWRIDNCVFENFHSNTAAIRIQNTSPTGLIDHSTFRNCDKYGIDLTWNGSADWVETVDWGSDAWVFIEDCKFEFSDWHHISTNNASKYVFRYNTVRDGSDGVHAIDQHGLTYWETSSRACEIYSNTINVVSRSAAINIRGGDALIYDNTINGSYYLGCVNFNVDGGGNNSCNGTGTPPESTYVWNNTCEDTPLVSNECGSEISIKDLSLHGIESANVWTGGAKPGYTPYTYPHPLRAYWEENPPTPHNETIQAALDLTTSASWDTIVIEDGTYTWLDYVDIPNSKVWIKSESNDSSLCVIKRGFNSGYFLRASNVDSIRITGITFDGNGYNGGGIDFSNTDAWRVDRCEFTGFLTDACLRLREFSGNETGVCDHTTFQNNTAIGGLITFANGVWETPLVLENEDAMFFEDCRFLDSGSRHISGENGAKIVVRYSSFNDGTDSDYMIGVNGYTGSYSNGVRSIEVYENDFTAALRGAGVRIGGGDGVVWNNIFNGDYIAGNVDLDVDASGGTCTGSTEDMTDALYVWGNTNNSNDLSLSNQCSAQLQEDDEYYLFQKPGYTGGYTYPHPLVSFYDGVTLPPSPPTGLSVSTASSSQLNLTWTDNSSDETGFKIERRSGASSFAQIDVAAADATSYNDTGLQPGTSYTYRVRATNSGGNSIYSNESGATTSASGTYTVSGLTIDPINPHYFKYRGDPFLLVSSGGFQDIEQNTSSINTYNISHARKQIFLYDANESDNNKPYQGNDMSNGFNADFWDDFSAQVAAMRADSVIVTVTLFMGSVLEESSEDSRGEHHVYHSNHNGPIQKSANDGNIKDEFYTLHDYDDFGIYLETYDPEWSTAKKVQYRQQEYIYHCMDKLGLINTTSGNDNVMLLVQWELEDYGGSSQSKAIAWYNSTAGFIRSLNPTILLCTGEASGTSEFSGSGLMPSWVIDDIDIDIIGLQNRPTTQSTIQDVYNAYWSRDLPIVFFGGRWYKVGDEDGDQDNDGGDDGPMIQAIRDQLIYGFHPAGPFDGFSNDQPDLTPVWNYLRSVNSYYRNSIDDFCDEPGQEIVSSGVPATSTPYSYTDIPAGTNCDGDPTPGTDKWVRTYPVVGNIYFYEFRNVARIAADAGLDVLSMRYNKIGGNSGLAEIRSIIGDNTIFMCCNDNIVADKDKFADEQYIEHPTDSDGKKSSYTPDNGYLNITTSHSAATKAVDYLPSYWDGLFDHDLVDGHFNDWSGDYWDGSAIIDGTNLVDRATIQAAWDLTTLITNSRSTLCDIQGGHESEGYSSHYNINGWEFYGDYIRSKDGKTPAQILTKLQNWRDNAVDPAWNFCEYDGRKDGELLNNIFRSAFAIPLIVKRSVFMHDEGTIAHGLMFFHDEYRLNLGYPVGNETEIKNSVWVQYYQNGCVVANTSNSASNTINSGELDGRTYYWYKGQQNPSLYDGSQFSSYTLQAPDGIVLMTAPVVAVMDIIVDVVTYNMTSIDQTPASSISGSWTEVKHYESNATPFGLDTWRTGNRTAYYWTSGSGTFRYPFDINVGGRYAVKIWYPNEQDDNLSGTAVINATLRVNHSGGTTNYTINMTANHDQWVFVDSLTFGENIYNIDLIAPGGGITIADAVKLVHSSSVDTGIVVVPPPVDEPPELTLSTNTIVLNEGQTASFTALASDDSSTATLTRSGSSVGTFVDNGNGTGSFAWNTTEGDAGTYNVTITAKDNKNQTDVEQCQITVNGVVASGSLVLTLSADNEVDSVFFNDIQIGGLTNSEIWETADRETLTTRAGENVLAIKGIDNSGVAGLVALLQLTETSFYSNASWKVSASYNADWQTLEYDDSGWSAATSYGSYGTANPWAQFGNVSGLDIDSNIKWIWSSDNDSDNTAYFRLTFTVSDEVSQPPSIQRVFINIINNQ